MFRVLHATNAPWSPRPHHSLSRSHHRTNEVAPSAPTTPRGGPFTLSYVKRAVQPQTSHQRTKTPPTSSPVKRPPSAGRVPSPPPQAQGEAAAFRPATVVTPRRGDGSSPQRQVTSPNTSPQRDVASGHTVFPPSGRSHVKVPPPGGPQGPTTTPGRSSLADRRSERHSTRMSTGSQALKEKWDTLTNAQGSATKSGTDGGGGGGGVASARSALLSSGTTEVRPPTSVPPRAQPVFHPQGVSEYSEKGKRQAAHDLRRNAWKAESRKFQGGSQGGGALSRTLPDDSSAVQASSSGTTEPIEELLTDVMVTRRHPSERLGVTFQTRTVLSGVQEGFAASRSGLERYLGHRVALVNGVKVQTLRQIKQACEDQQELTFTFTRERVSEINLLAKREGF